MERNHIRASNGPQFTTCSLLTNHGMNHLPTVLKADLVSHGVKLREVNGEQKSEDESLNIEPGNYNSDVLSRLPLICRIAGLHPTGPL